jgi:hypothetical protein
MPAKAGIRRFLNQTPAFAGATIILFAASVFAEETKPPVTYAPSGCEFSITFPSEPYKTRRCDENKPGQCYDQISYTQVYDMESTVNFRVTCNPVGEDVTSYYTEDVMKTTLKAMTKRSVVKTFDTSFRAEENYKQAGLVGEGKSGTLPTIYIAQLWIGNHSAFSVEGELIGDAADAPDELFSQVLKSVHYVDEPEKDADEPADKKDAEDAREKEKKDE